MAEKGFCWFLVFLRCGWMVNHLYIFTLTMRLSGGLTSTSDESDDVSVITVFVTIYCCDKPDDG